MNERPKHKDAIEKIKLKHSALLELECTSCGSVISNENININTSLAKCTSCNSVFKIGEDDFFKSTVRRGRPEMIMPEGTDVLTLPNSLDIQIDWLKSQPRASITFLTFFTVIWNGFIGIMAGSFIMSGMISELLFLSIHLLVGLGLLYYIMTVYLNYTDVIVTDKFLEISHRPIKIPFSSKKRIANSDIDQLYVTRYVASKTNNNPNYAYALWARLKNNKKIKLVKGMNKETQLYLEQEIERFINIEDQFVSQSITH